MPPVTTASGDGSEARRAEGVGVDVMAAMTAAPATEAARPAGVTAPDDPAGRGAPVTIERGCWREREPISVAQVSAAAAATAPAKPVVSKRLVPGDALDEASAKRVATPPLAKTCTASR